MNGNTPKLLFEEQLETLRSFMASFDALTQDPASTDEDMYPLSREIPRILSQGAIANLQANESTCLSDARMDEYLKLSQKMSILAKGFSGHADFCSALDVLKQSHKKGEKKTFATRYPDLWQEPIVQKTAAAALKLCDDEQDAREAFDIDDLADVDDLDLFAQTGDLDALTLAQSFMVVFCGPDNTQSYKSFFPREVAEPVAYMHRLIEFTAGDRRSYFEAVTEKYPAMVKFFIAETILATRESDKTDQSLADRFRNAKALVTVLKDNQDKIPVSTNLMELFIDAVNRICDEQEVAVGKSIPVMTLKMQIATLNLTLKEKEEHEMPESFRRRQMKVHGKYKL